MRDRSKILETLAAERTELEAHYRAMAPDALVTPCTDSEHPDGDRWTPKDHLAHLLRVEHTFLALAERTIQGDAAPLRFAGKTREEAIAGVHRDNEAHIAAYRSVALEALLQEHTQARAATLAFIATLTDEQLDTPIPGAPWSDGTIGGVLAANAGHERQHTIWADEGLAAAREG